MKTFLRLCVLLSVLASQAWSAPLRVSSFSSVLSEIASRVGGEEVEVTSHVAAGTDPHDFEPRPSDLKKVATSDLVLLSAKNLEGYAGKVREAAGAKVRVLEVGSKLPSLRMETESKGESVEDPHWWHSIDTTKKAVAVVREGLTSIRPDKAAFFKGNESSYLAELGELQKWAKAKVAELPKDRRKLVTSHDALQYLAKDYGFSVYSVSGLSSSAQPSSKQVAELLKTIKQQGVKAVFSEDTANPKVIKQMTAETGAVLGGELWVDGLGTGSAGTYVGMMRHNLTTIVEALK